MPSPVIDQTIAQVTASTTVMDSAKTLINSIGGLVSTAVTQALQNGATAAELEPVTAVVATLKAKSDELAEAVVLNTPSQP